ncbi:dihydrodipicolinate synthase family protein, partial [Pantoea ananatis]
IKEATGNLSRVSQIQQQVNDDFVLVSGDDATALDFMQLGGHGVISVTANIAAREMAELCSLAQQGKFAQARHLNQRLMHLHQKLFVEPNPIPVKWAAKRLGLIATDTLRLPMTPLTDDGCSVVEQALKDAGPLQI